MRRLAIVLPLPLVLAACMTNTHEATPGTVRYVNFRFPHGYHGRPAMVIYPEIHLSKGVYGDPSMTFGNDTDVGGHVFAQRPDGTLYPTRFMRA